MEKLDNLKRRYAELQQKHNLPSFEKLNEDFCIEKASETEVDILIREIRRFVSDKFLNYMRFIETIMNPTNASIFIFSVIKTLGEDEKKRLNEIYKKLAKSELELIDLDIVYSEEKEAEFIRTFYGLWQEVKNEMLEIMDKVKEDWDKEVEKVDNSFIR